MKKYMINNIGASLGSFFDEEVEAKNEIEAIEQILQEICDNIGNYVDIELFEIEENGEDEDEYK